MAPKQRQIRIEQRGGLEAIQALERRSDEELEAETKYKSAALAILGVRGALLILALIVVLLAIGLGIVELVSLPFGGVGLAPGLLLGLFLVVTVLAVVAAVGRRRRDRAKKSPPS